MLSLNKLLLILMIFNAYKLRSFNATKEYIIHSDNKEYLVLLYLKENIQITLMELEEISPSYYSTELTLESIYKYNKIFKQFDTLKEIFDCIQKLFELEKIKIYNKYDTISISLLMNSASCDNEEVIFKLEEKKMAKDEINERVRIETNILRKKIAILEEENKNLKNTINDYDSRLSYLELKQFNIDTKILTKISEYKVFTNELEQKYKKYNINQILVYRASRDGNQLSYLNNLFANYYNKNLLILFLIKKGFKFGIFLNKESNNNNRNNHDYYSRNQRNNNVLIPKSFLFSLKNNQIHYIENSDNIICFNNICTNEDNKCLINICNNNLLINEKKMEPYLDLANILNTDKKNGNKYFGFLEVEVFQISYNN